MSDELDQNSQGTAQGGAEPGAAAWQAAGQWAGEAGQQSPPQPAGDPAPPARYAPYLPPPAPAPAPAQLTPPIHDPASTQAPGAPASTQAPGAPASTQAPGAPASTQAPNVPAYAPAAQPPPGASALGILGFCLALAGVPYALVPFTIPFGFLLLLAAFALSLIAMFQQGRSKGLPIAGITVSVVGTILSLVVFFAYVGSSLAQDAGESSWESSEGSWGEEDLSPDSSSGFDGKQHFDQSGTREAPLPIGTTVRSERWELTVNSVNLDATQFVAEGAQFNERAAAGERYINVNVSMRYIGSERDGEMPVLKLDYIDADGRAYPWHRGYARVKNRFDDSATLFTGAKLTGNVSFSVPERDIEKGVISFAAPSYSEKAFFAVK